MEEKGKKVGRRSSLFHYVSLSSLHNKKKKGGKKSFLPSLKRKRKK